jgi:hypothetical protein
MTLIQILFAIVPIISLLISIGVAYGVLKGGMGKYMKHTEHTTICHTKSDETNALFDKLFDRVDATTSKVDDLNGYIRGRLGE